MTAADRDAAARRQRAQTIALWRWALIEPAMDDALTSRQRGQVVRGLAGREHAGPSGRTVPVSRKTIDRWITARRAGRSQLTASSCSSVRPPGTIVIGIRKRAAGLPVR